MGYKVVLATNPIFPAIATESRMRWAGLAPEDFDYYTTYENQNLTAVDMHLENLDEKSLAAYPMITRSTSFLQNAH